MATDLHRDVLDDLGGRIAGGDLRPGRVLTLAQLEQEYRASRTVVREAVRVLESIRMLASRRRVGITVLPRDQWDEFDPLLIQWSLAGRRRQHHLESLMELRVAVEPMAARLAATRATPEQRTELLRLAEEMGELGRRGLADSQDYLDADIAYHGIVLAASGNPMLMALKHPVHEVLIGRTRFGMHPAVPAPGTLEDHVRVALDIAAGDADAAERHSRGHMRAVWGEIAQSQDDRR